MAKDTEKLIRQLSLISYLMAERRPVTATEIRRDVEGYSDMTEDAFARRFYADRAELDALGIHLSVDKPADGFSEQENYSLAPEAFHLPAIEFTDDERAALQTALTLLDGEFAYAEPLRLALQQITWGRPSPLGSDLRQTIGLGITASAGGAELSARLAKIDTAIYRRKRIEFDYYTMQSDETQVAQGRPVPPAVRGRAVLPRRALARAEPPACACSASRGSAGRSPTRRRPSTTSSARPTSIRASSPAASRGSSATPPATAEVWVSDDVSWYVERQFGAYGELRDKHLPHRLRDAAADHLVGARAARARAHRRPAAARRRGARADRPDHRAPPRRAGSRSPRCRPGAAPRPRRNGRAPRQRGHDPARSASPGSSRSRRC